MICHEDALRLFCHIRVKLSWMTLLTYSSEKKFSSTVWGRKGWKICSSSCQFYYLTVLWFLNNAKECQKKKSMLFWQDNWIKVHIQSFGEAMEWIIIYLINFNSFFLIQYDIMSANYDLNKVEPYFRWKYCHGSVLISCWGCDQLSNSFDIHSFLLYPFC